MVLVAVPGGEAVLDSALANAASDPGTRQGEGPQRIGHANDGRLYLWCQGR